MEVKRLSENVPFIILKSIGDMRFINKLLLRFVSKREAFCIKTGGVLYGNGKRFVSKRGTFCMETGDVLYGNGKLSL